MIDKPILIEYMPQMFFHKEAVYKKDDEWYCKKCNTPLDEFQSTLALCHNTVSCKNGHNIGLGDWKKAELVGYDFEEI